MSYRVIFCESCRTLLFDPDVVREGDLLGEIGAELSKELQQRVRDNNFGDYVAWCPTCEEWRPFRLARDLSDL